MRVTVSLIKADVGSLAGHHRVYKEQMEVAKQKLEEAKKAGLIIDYYVFNAGDDLELLMTQQVSKKYKLYAAGQDLLVEAFSGNVRGMGPGVAEMEFEERKSEPIVVFAADKTEPGAWNLAVFRIFADPFNTAGLVIDPVLHEGFDFVVYDVIENKEVEMHCPSEMYDLLALIGTPGRYVISRVYRHKDHEIAAVASTTRLSLIAGRYVGKDDPVLIVRAQHGFPAVGEILEAFDASTS